jgi:hypothetical protein
MKKRKNKKTRKGRVDYHKCICSLLHIPVEEGGTEGYFTKTELRVIFEYIGKSLEGQSNASSDAEKSVDNVRTVRVP